MAKQRYINTAFWDDSYIAILTPIEKLLFLYLLTNPLTNIMGIYEISLRRISFDTGIPPRKIGIILKKFSENKKILYKDGYIAIRNFLKHQKLNPSIEKGIELLKKQVPATLLGSVETGCIQAVTDSPQTPTNININNNLNLNPNNNDNKKYGEFQNVLLTDDEFQKLNDKFNSQAKDLIENLSVYLESTGKKYKSHYATILNWNRRNNELSGSGQGTTGKTEDKYDKYDKVTTIANTDRDATET